MPFTFTNYQPLPPEQASPLSAAISGLLSGVNAGPGFRKSMTEAKYAPQTIQADIFGKEFAPLAAIISSPLAQSMIGQQGTNQLFQMMSQLLKQNVSGFGGQSGMQPGQQNSQPMSDQGGDNNPNMQTNSPNTNGGGDQQPTNGQLSPALANAAGGTGSELAQKAIAGATEQLHPPGMTYFDPKNPTKAYSQYEPGMIEMSQKTYSAIKSALPYMQDIIKKAPQFLDPGQNVSTSASNIAGFLSRNDPTATLGWGKGGAGYISQLENYLKIDPEKISRYDDWNQEKLQTAEIMKRAYPSLATSDEAMKIVMDGLTPGRGETTSGFAKRMYSNMDRAIKLADQSQQNILNGMPLTEPLQMPNGTQQNTQPINMPPQSNENASSYDKNGNNTTGNPQDVIDNYNKKNTSPEQISSQLKNVSKPDFSSPAFTYSEGKEPPPGYKWMQKGSNIKAILNYMVEEAKKRHYKEVG